MNNIIRNFVSLILAEVVTRVGGFGLFIFIAVFLKAEALGEFSFALAVTAYLQILTDFGLSSLGIKEIAKDKTQTSRVGSQIFYVQLSFAVLSLIVLFIILKMLHMDSTIELVTLLYGLSVIPSALNVSYLFQAHQKMHYVAITRTIGQLAYLVVGFGLVYYYRSIVVLPVVQLVANSVIALAAFMYARRVLHFQLSWIDWSGLRTILIRSLPFALSALMVQIFYNSDSIFIQFMMGSESLGYYQAGYKLVMFVILIYGFLGTALFPHFSAKSSSIAFGQMIETFKRLTTILSLSIFPISLIWAMQADDVLHVVYWGEDYRAAIASFTILSLGMIVVIYNQLLGSALLAMDGQRAALKAVSIAAISNIGLNIVLIPRLGLAGAALSTVLAEGLNMAYMQYHTHQYFGQAILKNYVLSPLWPTLGLVVASLVFKQAFHSPWLGMLVAGIVYVAIVLALRIITIPQIIALLKQSTNKELLHEST